MPTYIFPKSHFAHFTPSPSPNVQKAQKILISFQQFNSFLLINLTANANQVGGRSAVVLKILKWSSWETDYICQVGGWVG